MKLKPLSTHRESLTLCGLGFWGFFVDNTSKIREHTFFTDLLHSTSFVKAILIYTINPWVLVGCGGLGRAFFWIFIFQFFHFRVFKGDFEGRGSFWPPPSPHRVKDKSKENFTCVIPMCVWYAVGWRELRRLLLYLELQKGPPLHLTSRGEVNPCQKLKMLIDCIHWGREVLIFILIWGKTSCGVYSSIIAYTYKQQNETTIKPSIVQYSFLCFSYVLCWSISLSVFWNFNFSIFPFSRV